MDCKDHDIEVEGNELQIIAEFETEVPKIYSLTQKENNRNKIMKKMQIWMITLTK